MSLNDAGEDVVMRNARRAVIEARKAIAEARRVLAMAEFSGSTHLTDSDAFIREYEKVAGSAACAEIERMVSEEMKKIQDEIWRSIGDLEPRKSDMSVPQRPRLHI